MAADSSSRRDPTPTRRGRLAGLWGALIGGVLGFSVGVTAYLALTPVLEAATGWVRELQGLSWNLVPGLTILGAVGGLLIGLARRRRIVRQDS